jgi:alginate O-acetyltransferase complex protein AlgI
MLFCSEQFLIFFLVVFTAYWALPWPRARVYLLLAASFCFYAYWNPWLAGIVAASSTFDFLIGRALDRSNSAPWRRLLLLASLAANLGLLCYFKYANFFLRSLEDALCAAGVSASFPVLQVLLPIGISFYTFEAINYTVDVYRRQVRAETNLAHFMLFILFFPHLVAGPIVRARDFLHQVRRKKRWNWQRVQLGLQLVLLGLVKKLVVADRLALIVDPVFADPTLHRVEVVWFAVLGYALQIYCDFSGYSDLALGTAHLLGYRLAPNFAMPYAAVNVSEFWRRWHISLSSWLRDYLFIPLGGSRQGGWKTCRNLMLTMALGGLWHGASWTFVAWGVLHGLFLIVHRLFRAAVARSPRLERGLGSPLLAPLRVGLTFGCVTLAWVFFRAPTLAGALAVFRQLAGTGGTLALPFGRVGFWLPLGLLVAGHLAGRAGLWRRLARVPAPVLGVAYALALTLTLVLAPPAGKTFIYFQF